VHKGKNIAHFCFGSEKQTCCGDLWEEIETHKSCLDGKAVVASLVGSSVSLGANVARYWACSAASMLYIKPQMRIWGFVLSMLEEEGIKKEEALSRRALKGSKDNRDNVVGNYVLRDFTQDISADKGCAGTSRDRDITDPTLEDVYVTLSMHRYAGELLG